MKIKEITDDEIIFENGVVIRQHHDQDCCEWVYADFKYLNLLNINPRTGATVSIKDIDFKEPPEIDPIKDTGFNLVATDGTKWFVPCHNIQNGYYSDDLRLEISPFEITIDISECAKYEDG